MEQTKKYKGVIAYMSVLVMSTLLLASGLTVIVLSSDIFQTTANYNDFIVAKLKSENCLEEAIARLKYEQGYTGTINLTFPTGTCTAVTTESGTTDVKDLNISGSYDNSSFERDYTVDVSDYPVVVTKQ